ncbi:ABC transporter ATP-binding protein [Phycicoccus endophyticus]|uniref:ABC transporter ATP-binding protein n=1 Tax=Phycicoccus endophyticus TaxID=1690220 RepID=A0A7G9R164_9MICO|nr:ABC transporter ATP-binding protein [Phycicoccus endophyticus]NHI20529.1 ABC transporter ATP-binding protein [Phycicoccus endophyticus]QNN49339.1 ABC transporter ATP-binding protein [Phycicoccus endophyticus]GGL45246.1 ABC transporter ATP-binding protein [Phycicoccus endophyticus]
MTPPAAPTPTATAAARAVGLVKEYGAGQEAVRALDGVDVAFAAGEFTAIMGASGSGKSTLMHLLAGLDAPTCGQVFLGDTDLTRLSDRELALLRRRRVGFVFQAFNLLPMLTARQNITLPLKLAGRTVERAWLNQVAGTLGLTERLDHRPSELSGGQQQRVAMARALVTHPDVLFADEPTGALDSHTSGEMLAFLRRSVREFGQTVVMVTHDPAAASAADRVVLLRDGRLVGDLTGASREDLLDAMGALGATA